ncbi:MAG: type 4a pilus biogenesis protein PilO [Thermodesulfobacteriota bacterium]
MKLDTVTNFLNSIDKAWLSEYRKELIAILVILASGLLYYQVVYSKNMFMMDKLNEKVVSLKKEIAIYSRDVSAIKERADEMKTMREEVRRLERRFLLTKSRLPSERQLASIIKDITGDEIKGDIDFLSVKPLALEDKEEYFRLPFRIDVQGAFLDIAGYLKRLEELSRVINVENLRMESGRGRGKMLKVQVYASTFVLSAN